MSGRMLHNFTVIIGCLGECYSISRLSLDVGGGMLYNFTVIVGCRGECYTISRLSLDVGGNDIQFHGYCSMSGGMLYLGLFFLNTVHCEASLDIIQKTEVLIRPLDGNNIWNVRIESQWWSVQYIRISQILPKCYKPRNNHEFLSYFYLFSK